MSAVISECGQYRYELRRVWDEALPVCTWIMLNPSTADAEQDDPTIRKCIGFTKQWCHGTERAPGFGGIVVGNLFAFRSTDPRGLLGVSDPVGPENYKHLKAMLVYANENSGHHDHPVVLAWGRFPRTELHDKAARVMWDCWLRRETPGLFCLGRTKGGQPRHPLMLAYATPLEPY